VSYESRRAARQFSNADSRRNTGLYPHFLAPGMCWLSARRSSNAVSTGSKAIPGCSETQLAAVRLEAKKCTRWQNVSMTS